MLVGLWLLLALFPLGGCYSYTTVRVNVIDALTREPITGASVRTDYDRALLHSGPRADDAVTGGDGEAKLRVARDPYGIVFIASAPGYDPSEVPVYPADSPYRSGPDWKPVEWPLTDLTISLRGR